MYLEGDDGSIGDGENACGTVWIPRRSFISAILSSSEPLPLPSSLKVSSFLSLDSPDDTPRETINMTDNAPSSYVCPTFGGAKLDV